MITDEDNFSDVDFSDYELPPDYFDIFEEDNGDSDLKTLSDLSLEVLHHIVEPLSLRDRARAARSCGALRKAVVSSRCLNFGNGVLTLTCVDIIVSAGLHHIIRDPARLWYRASFGGERDHIPIDKSNLHLLPVVRKLFKSTHLKEIRLEQIPLDRLDHFHQALDEFLEPDENGKEVEFDRLTISMREYPEEMNEWTMNLMSKAKKEVVINLAKGIDIEQDFGRPVTFKAPSTEPWRTQLSDSGMLELIKRGHSFACECHDLSKERFEEGIKAIAAAGHAQRVEIRNSGDMRNAITEFVKEVVPEVRKAGAEDTWIQDRQSQSGQADVHTFHRENVVVERVEIQRRAVRMTARMPINGPPQGRMQMAMRGARPRVYAVPYNQAMPARRIVHAGARPLMATYRITITSENYPDEAPVTLARDLDEFRLGIGASF